MATDAQITANRQNAQHSTGPQTETGKAASSQNNFRHGLAGYSFRVLPSENQCEFNALLAALTAEHQPSTITEALLVEKMAQHHWLSRRAQHLQDLAMDDDLPLRDQERRFALFLRYQTTNDRAFHTTLNTLLKLRAEKRRSRLDEAALSQRAEDVKKIGFESQQRAQAAESRRESAENRKKDEAARSQRAEDRKNELHQWAVLLAEAKLTHQQVLTNSLELDQVLAVSPANHLEEAKQAA